VGAGELLAATTTSIAQAARGESSDIWVPLLAALLGAVVGGLLALAGSVLVNRWELRRTARLGMYVELLPRVKNETWPRFRGRGEGREAFEQSLDALKRAGAIVGPRESVSAVWISLKGVEYVSLASSARRTLRKMRS
jgi:hypothetical protein